MKKIKRLIRRLFYRRRRKFDNRLVGHSFSLCVDDILSGKVLLSDVKVIKSDTKLLNYNDFDS